MWRCCLSTTIVDAVQSVNPAAFQPSPNFRHALELYQAHMNTHNALTDCSCDMDSCGERPHTKRLQGGCGDD